MFKISEATDDDIPAIIEIAEKTWWPTYAEILTVDQIRYMLDTIYAPQIIRSQLLNGSQTYLVLKEHDRPEGFASFGPLPDEPGRYKIHKLYVLPDNQNRGYGRALIEHIKDRLRQKNIHSVDLNVNRFNIARQFYERVGFRIIHQEDIPIGPYWMNDYVMRITF